MATQIEEPPVAVRTTIHEKYGRQVETTYYEGGRYSVRRWDDLDHGYEMCWYDREGRLHDSIG